MTNVREYVFSRTDKRNGGRKEGGEIKEMNENGSTHHLATTTGMKPHTYNLPFASAVEICTLAYLKPSFSGRPNTAPGGGGANA